MYFIEEITPQRSRLFLRVSFLITAHETKPKVSSIHHKIES